MKSIINIFKKSSVSEKVYLLVSIIFWALWSFCTAAVIIFAVLMCKEVMDYGKGADVFKYWLPVILVFVGKGILLTLANLFSHLTGYKIVTRLRLSLLDRLKAFSLGFYTKERLGNITTIAHYDIDNVESLIAHLWVRLISDALVSIGIGTGLFIIDWRLGLALISLLPIAFLFLYIGEKVGSKYHKENRDKMADMVSSFTEFVKGIMTIKAFTENETFFDKLKLRIQQFKKTSIDLAVKGLIPIGGYNIFLDLCYGVLVSTACYLILGKSISLIVFVVFFILGKEFYKPFANAEAYSVYFVRVKDSINRINTVLEHPVIAEPDNPKTISKYDIEFNDVFFNYDQNEKVLENVSFTIPQNTITALVGESGTGKTTITSLLLRFWDVNSGEINIGGVNIKDILYDDLLSDISIVMQNVILFNDSIFENIKIGKKDASYEEVINASKKAMIHDFIMSLPDGYNTKVDESGVSLSGGEKQRISIARAILKDSPIIVLDEATSAIDPINEHKIQMAISNLIKNKTVLVIAHHLHTVKNVDQLIVLKNHGVLEKGRHDELIKIDGEYKKLWSAQTDIKTWKNVQSNNVEKIAN